MPRARNIKPSFFVNDELADVSAMGRLLFIGLWTIADREGRLEDKPKKIKVQVLPYDSVNVDSLLNDLQEKGFIIRYQTDKCPCIQIVNFTKHQNPHMKEQASELPPPDLHHASTMQEQNKHETSPADSLLLNPDSLNRIPDKNKKHSYAEFVSMTKDQHQKLIDEYGETATKRMIEILDNYKGAKGKKYKDDYRAIKNWVVERYYEEQAKAPSGKPARKEPPLDLEAKKRIEELNRQLAGKKDLNKAIEEGGS